IAPTSWPPSDHASRRRPTRWDRSFANGFSMRTRRTHGSSARRRARDTGCSIFPATWRPGWNGPGCAPSSGSTPVPTRTSSVSSATVAPPTVARRTTAGRFRPSHSAQHPSRKRHEAMALHFDRGEYADRMNRLKTALDERGLDGILLFAQESMYWLTGYDTFGFCFFQCLYVGGDGTLALLTRSPDLRQARHTSIIEDI